MPAARVAGIFAIFISLPAVIGLLGDEPSAARVAAVAAALVVFFAFFFQAVRGRLHPRPPAVVARAYVIDLVIACTLDDEHGIARLEEIIEVAFEQSGSRTRLLLNSTARGPSAEAAVMLAGMQKGWAQTVDRLGALLNPQRDKEM